MGLNGRGVSEVEQGRREWGRTGEEGVRLNGGGGSEVERGGGSEVEQGKREWG